MFPTFMRYYVNVTANIVGYAKETRTDAYKIKFHSNGGTGNMQEMVVGYNETTNLTKNTFVLENYNFGGWNTEPDGSGTNYEDEQEIRQTEHLDGNEINLYAQWTQDIARIGSTYYPTLKEAAITNNFVYTTFARYLREGKTEFKGHICKYANQQPSQENNQ